MSELRIYYGSLEKNIEITKKVFDLLLVDTYLIFPADDNLRADIFSDPCFKVVKSIMVSGLTNSLTIISSKQTIAIDTQTNQLIDDITRLRKWIPKTRLSPEQRAKSLHPLIKLNTGSMADEFPEQCMAMKFLTGSETILEIGGNVGRNSILIASILQSEQQLVVMECSPKIANELRLNRHLNQMKFQIENAALSKKKLIQKGWTTVQSNVLLDGYSDVPITSYADLQAKYKLEFDTLVLDCEGAFYYILDDFPEILDHITTIIVENDYMNTAHKAHVDAQLVVKGFSCVYQKEGCEVAKELQFSCITNFYEVWKKVVVNPVIIPASSMVKGAKFMDKYPCVLFFRHDKYRLIDYVFDDVPLECSVKIIDSAKDLELLYDVNYPLLVTYGESDQEYFNDVYKIVTSRINKRWIHYKDPSFIQRFVQSVNHCYIHNVLSDRTQVRPVFSIFTTCYNSYDKINRAYKSIQAQTYLDWEWVILDDSPDDAHFNFLRKKFSQDKKIRLYKRSCNSGNIGNVKNEAVSLCRGKYVLEMDHDDEILPDVVKEAVLTFEADPEVGFVYMDFINIYENGNNFSYSDFICKGYGGYYKQKYNGKWVNVYMTPNVNNITLSHIVCLPNHPRIWRLSTLLTIGNYSELLPICDDQEIIMRTAMETKIAKIPKLGYVQYMNDGNNNFSLIRNREINRLGPQFIVPQFYKMYKVNDKMKELNAYEDETYLNNCSKLWTRENYQHKYCNSRVQYDYDQQICIIGTKALAAKSVLLKELYQNPRIDFLLLDGTGNKDYLCELLDSMNFSRMKCYSLADTPVEQLKNYFYYLYQVCENVTIYE